MAWPSSLRSACARLVSSPDCQQRNPDGLWRASWCVPGVPYVGLATGLEIMEPIPHAGLVSQGRWWGAGAGWETRLPDFSTMSFSLLRMAPDSDQWVGSPCQHSEFPLLLYLWTR